MFYWNIIFGSRVNVVNITRAELLHSFDLPKTVCLEFSPKNNVLAMWQAYASEYCTSWGSTGFVHVWAYAWVSTWLASVARWLNEQFRKGAESSVDSQQRSGGGREGCHWPSAAGVGHPYPCSVRVHVPIVTLSVNPVVSKLWEVLLLQWAVCSLCLWAGKGDGTLSCSRCVLPTPVHTGVFSMPRSLFPPLPPWGASSSCSESCRPVCATDSVNAALGGKSWSRLGLGNWPGCGETGNQSRQHKLLVSCSGSAVNHWQQQAA